MRGDRWNNVPGIFTVELAVEDNTIINSDGDVLKLSQAAVAELLPLDMDIAIHFRSNGYYDPGVCSGPVEKCYPPEGEDERILEFATAGTIKLSAGTAQALFDLYEEKIMEVEIDRNAWELDHDDWPKKTDYDRERNI